MRSWVFLNQKTNAFKIAPFFKKELGVDAYDLFGLYDVVIRLEADTISGLDEYIHKIQEFPMVASTTTYLATHPKTKHIQRPPGAYFLIDVAPLRNFEVCNKIFELEEVQRSDIVWGPYDVLCEVFVESLPKLMDVLQEIYQIHGIVKTITMLTYPQVE